jgi:pectin methylesterase-like acyl-CoA thioesterase
MKGMSRNAFVVSVIAGLSLGVARAGDATRFVVSPKADRADGSFATLQAACLAARNAGTDKPRTVVVEEGEYFMD